MSRRQIHLAVRFPGAGDTTGRTDRRSTSRIEFSSFERLARTAERGLFDFLLLAEGPYERRGHHQDLEAACHPDPVTVLGALAGVTEHLGLAATVDATCHEPYGLARRFATLDHLSGGRAAWNVLTSADAATGENFRRGGFLDRADRYRRTAEFLDAARELWDSWTPDGVARPFAHRGRHFDIAGEFTVPRSPQGHPVVIQAGDCEEERELAAATADVLLSGPGPAIGSPGRHGGRHSPLAEGQARYADVKRRLAKYGRAPDDLRIMPVVSVVLGDTATEAQEKSLPIRRSAIEAERPRFLAGTPEAVATELEEFVRREAADGFVLVPHPTPGSLEEFVDRVVPLLQERGAFRTEYRGTTLHSHLGVPDPAQTAQKD
ncbi:LLM class flavin-dependent oxidoreductase [Streptomyces sp. NPDC005374]|uniref:LLM class flavin-dependent oxidoreductase n=1 Tax=Streptomyces sp. NPDC005374 TaxID=3364713 RepID=UPI0036A6872B